MIADLRGRLLRGLGANAYDQFVTVLVQLIGVPILLHAWGTRMYGEWLILSAIPAWMALADLGFSQSASNDMTAKVARGEKHGAIVVFQSLAVLVYTLATVGPVVIALFIWVLPIDRWFSLETLSQSEIHWTLWLLASSVLVSLADGVSLAGFRATGDYAIQRGLSASGRLIQFAGVWLAAIVGWGPMIAAAIFLGVRVVTVIIALLIFLRRHSWFSLGIRFADRSVLKALLKPAMASVAIILASATVIQGMTLVVGALLGPLSVVVFTTLRTLTRLAFQIVVSVSNTAEPEFAAAFGVQNDELMRDLFVQVLRAGLWMASLAALGMLLVGPTILAIWTHGAVKMDYPLFILLLISALASIVWYGSLIVLRAMNRHARAALVYAATTMIALVVGWVLLSTHGQVADAGVALLVSDTVMAIYVLGVAASVLRVNSMRSLSGALNPMPLIRMVRGA